MSPPGSDQGVTSTEIKIAMTVINAGGSFGNSAFGVFSPSQQQAYDQYVIDSINASGGVACRKLVAEFFQANPVDETSLQQVCLEIAQAGVFFAIDGGSYALYPQLETCYGQNHIPFFSFELIPQQEQSQFYPYLFAQGVNEVVYRNMVLGLAEKGYFDPANGFHKVGFIYRDCDARLPGEVVGWLHQAGLSSSKISTYDVGCPAAGFASPSEIEQAIVQFQSQGVTNVIEVQDAVDFANFTTIAQQQGFHPRYGVSGGNVLPTTYTNTHPDYQNLANAIAIPQTRWGEERTPGLAPTAGTARCNAIFAAHGQPPVWDQSDGIGGDDCNNLWLFQVAADHAPTLRRDALAAGLQAAGSIDFSFPYGPADFRAPGTNYASEFWREDQFFTSCECWRVIDPTFHPSFR